MQPDSVALWYAETNVAKLKKPSKLTILGCGPSTGVPYLKCECKVCRSKDPKNNRLRTSAWIETGGLSILLDTSPDLRLQALRERIFRVDAVLFTHPHADHTHGIDDLRNYNYLQKNSIPVYGNAWTCEELQQKFPYIFKPALKLEGGGIPKIQLNQIDSTSQNLDILGIPVVPISVEHGSKECLGYRIDSVAYVTDCSYIPAKSLSRLKDLSVLVLDCLRLAPHDTHLNLEQAIGIVEEIRPKRTFLTHLGHDFDYKRYSKKLPKGVFLAYDGLKIAF